MVSDSITLEPNLPGEKYKIVESTQPKNYPTENKGISVEITVVSETDNKIVNFYNKPSCEVEYSELSATERVKPSKRIELYKKYGKVNLLNLGEDYGTDAARACGNPSVGSTLTFGCLKANTNVGGTFGPTNLTEYTHTRTFGGKTAYCKVIFEFSNEIDASSKFAENSGIYVKLGRPMYLQTQAKVGVGKLTEVCYSYPVDHPEYVQHSGKIYDTYIEGVYFPDKKLIEKSSLRKYV